MLSPVFDFGRNWDVLPSFVSRHSNVSLSPRSDSRAYRNLPQAHIKAQTYFTSLSSSFTINLFAKNCWMHTYFLNHVIYGDTPTRPSKGMLQSHFSKLSRFETLSIKMISHSWGHSNPDLWGILQPRFLKIVKIWKSSFVKETIFHSRGYSNPIFQLQINHFFLPRFPRICQTNLV